MAHHNQNHTYHRTNKRKTEPPHGDQYLLSTPQPRPTITPSYALDDDFQQSDAPMYPTNDTDNDVFMQGYFPSGEYCMESGGVDTRGSTSSAGWFNVLTPSPSVMIDDTNSLVMVQHGPKKRTYSDHSNETSGGESENLMSSTPDDAECSAPPGQWFSGAEYAVDLGHADEDLMAMSHDQWYIPGSWPPVGKCKILFTQL